MRIILFFCLLLTVITPNVFSQNLTDSFYSEIIVLLSTPSGVLEGTITVPDKFKKGPIVLIISGSGPTDRDGNSPMIIGKNNSLLQLAHSLAKHNIASLRFDKRGVGKSSKALSSEYEIRFDDFVNDASAWVQFIKNDRRFTKIIIAGHSEGSLIGMIAAQHAVDQFISIAGAGFPANEILKTHLASLPENLKNESFSIIDSLTNGQPVSNPPATLNALFRKSVQPYLISWFRYNPQVEISKLTIPTLIIQGDNDLQVTVKDAETLKKGKPNSVFFIVQTMNHVLKKVGADKTENVKSYSNPELPISEELVNQIVSFIKKSK
jgi:pimeloyl-ACP methyl ester carboxylesterase